MQFDPSRTIFAVGSPLAPASRGIVRLTGPDTRLLLRSLLSDNRDDGRLGQSTSTACHPAALVEARQPSYGRGRVNLAWFGRTVEVGVYYWPTQQSFTGQPSAELHLLGSLPLLHRVMDRLMDLGASPAERGEFTLRAFLAGRIDLVQAEAILGVIESVAGQQLQWALSQLGGNISQPVRQLKHELVSLLAHLEAGLDFVEEDIEFISPAQLSERLTAIAGRIDGLIGQLQSRGSAASQLTIALVGLPNAGKSSLFNALLGRERAIVADRSGTTRDAIAAPLELGEMAVRLIDTAGLEPLEDDSPRARAQQVLRERIETCDIVLLCYDSSIPPTTDWLDRQMAALQSSGRRVIVVATKHDLDGGRLPLVAQAQQVSIHVPASIDQLRDRLSAAVQAETGQRFTRATHHTAVRCREALQRAADGIERAQTLLAVTAGEELVASELHCVLEELSAIIGEVHRDDILGEIFSRFCIGK